MPKLRKSVSFETTFGTYTVNELLGEGGGGRVYGGVDSDNSAIALKLLDEQKANSDKRKRFKNEIAFLARNKHPNIVTVTDHGVARGGDLNGPFYVMSRYTSSLRTLIQGGAKPETSFKHFAQIIDGVEAAHLQGAIHRDLKPENILYSGSTGTLAIADFGIAQFTEDLVATQVETGPSQRLANFVYAAPEQRGLGNKITTSADIYALGLMLNEMFTGVIPHGTDYQLIGRVSSQFGWLDQIVERMLRQKPNDRPASIAELKQLINRYSSEALSLQRLSEINATVIVQDEIDNPLAIEPPNLVGADWNRGQLTLVLDRPINQRWTRAFFNMGNYNGIMGNGPEIFRFDHTKAIAPVQEHVVQAVINHFKNWLPKATAVLRAELQQEARARNEKAVTAMRHEREAEEQRLRIMRTIQI